MRDDDDSLGTLALLGAGGALAAAALASRDERRARRLPSQPIELRGAHVVPLPFFGEYEPRISNEWKPRDGHLGIDLMYRRTSRVDQLGLYRLGSPNGARDFFMPDGTLAVAAADGVVRFANYTPRRWTVILDHDDGTSTYYTHLETLSVTRTTSSRAPQHVITGQPLGVIGYDPLDGARLKHLHFELWLGRLRDRATDPAPYLAHWLRVRLLPRGTGAPEIQIIPR